VASFLEVGWVWVQSPSSCPTNLWAFNVANFSQSLSCGVDTVAVNVDKLIRNVATLQVPGESEDPEKGSTTYVLKCQNNGRGFFSKQAFCKAKYLRNFWYNKEISHPSKSKLNCLNPL